MAIFYKEATLILFASTYKMRSFYFSINSSDSFTKLFSKVERFR